MNDRMENRVLWGRGKGAEADAQLFVSGFSSAQGDPPVKHENILTFNRKKSTSCSSFPVSYYLLRRV